MWWYNGHNGHKMPHMVVSGEKYPMGFYDIEWTNCYQLSSVFYYRSQLIVNRFFYKTSGDYVESLQDVLATWQFNWQTVILPMFSDGYTGFEYRILRLFGDRQTDLRSAVGDTGQDNQAQLPAFFGQRYRLYPADTRVRKGRKIFTGCTEAMVDGDSLNAAYTARSAAIAAFLSGTLSINQVDFVPSLLSPANTRHTANLTAEITVATFAGFSTQNSRKIGRGV